MTLIGPLFWYELRRLPRRRMHLWRILYAAALLLGLVVVYLRSFRDRSAFEALTDPGPLDLAGNAAFAETYLMAFLAVQQLAVIALTPLYAAGSIADEKERRTFDFLLSSPLPHYQILLGKLLARLVYVGSILAVGLPVLMLTFLFGGVDFEHLLAGFAVAVVSAIFLGSLGVMLASQKNSLRETLPGLATALLAPACLGLCGLCKSILAAASPITVLPILFGHWHVGESTGDDTWFTVGVFAAVHLSLSLLLVIAAKAALRDQSAPEARPVELPVPPAPAIHPPPFSSWTGSDLSSPRIQRSSPSNTKPKSNCKSRRTKKWWRWRWIGPNACSETKTSTVPNGSWSAQRRIPAGTPLWPPCCKSVAIRGHANGTRRPSNKPSSRSNRSARREISPKPKRHSPRPGSSSGPTRVCSRSNSPSNRMSPEKHGERRCARMPPRSSRPCGAPATSN